MGKKVKIDMSGIETFTTAKEGIHTVKLVEAEQIVAQSGNDAIKVVFEVIKGESKGARIFENFTLTDKALWKLKSFLQVVGIKCEGKIALDLDNMVGKVCDVDVFHEEYNGRNQAKISEFLKASTSKAAQDEDYEDDEDEDEDEDEVPAPKKKAKAAPLPEKKAPVKKKKPEPEDDEDEDDEDEDEDDEDDDDDDDDDEDEEPAPKKKAPPAKKKVAEKPKAKKKPAPVEDDDDDDDEEWPEEDED